MTFKGRANIGISIFVVFIVFFISFSTLNFWIFTNVYVYIACFFLLAIPYVFTKSRALYISEKEIGLSYLGGLIKEYYEWSQIEEANHIASTLSRQTMNVLKIVADRMIGDVFQLIVTDNEPIVINTKNYKNGKEIYQELSKYVKFVRRHK